MEYDFLKQFSKRMKSVGMYSTLVKNSLQKTTWKQYGFESMDEQMNLLYAVLLFVMEQSLKEEQCTIDDISIYVDEICNRYFHKKFSYEMSLELTDFIVNMILCDEGRAMYFDCFDFEHKKYKTTNVSYLANEIIYTDDNIKRTSYKLTDNGYNLMLSTLEVENNMKLTIHEIIFKMHLERASYDKALSEVKNIFNLLRIQLQKIQEAMDRIRRNALSYSVSDYQQILEENLAAIGETKEKFLEYRHVVHSRVKDLEEENINIRALDEENMEKLLNLQKIEEYLNEAIDEHQKILNRHFDLKELYSKELEQISQMSLIKRFSLRNELYDKIIEHPGKLTEVEYFLRPLFRNDPVQIYNLNKCLQVQKPLRMKVDEDEGEILEFDADTYEAEKERKQRERLSKYERSLRYILGKLQNKRTFELRELESISDADIRTLIPNVEIFKEIMVEFIKTASIDIESLRTERSSIVAEDTLNFQLNEMILQILDDVNGNKIKCINIKRVEGGEVVAFDNVYDETGDMRKIYCSNVLFECIYDEK